MVSRIENAKMRCTTGEVMELCEAYGISGDQRAELIQLARDARKQGWWPPYREVLRAGFGDYLAFEAEAVGLRAYDIHLIPGLFQTEAYARRTHHIEASPNGRGHRSSRTSPAGPSGTPDLNR
jgi:hypothetical protein